MVALVVGIAVALLGLVIPALRLLYDYAWFVGFGVSGAAYTANDAAFGGPLRRPRVGAGGIIPMPVNDDRCRTQQY